MEKKSLAKFNCFFYSLLSCFLPKEKKNFVFLNGLYFLQRQSKMIVKLTFKTNFFLMLLPLFFLHYKLIVAVVAFVLTYL